MKLVQELAGRFGRRNLMPDQLGQSGVGPQVLEIFQTIAARRVQNHDALHVAGFIQSTLSLFQRQIPICALARSQRSERLHQQRHAAKTREVVFGLLFVVSKRQRQLGR
jgi:hypothetical protein